MTSIVLLQGSEHFNLSAASSYSSLTSTNCRGQTFGPLLRFATNGTIASTEEGGGAVEEEAVVGAEVAE